MGWMWTYAYGEKNKQKLMTEELEKYGDIKVLKSSMKGSEYYAACVSARKPEEVWAIVCLVKLDKNGDWGYKDMDETMGPCYYNCPKAIIDLLTETTNEWALEWRRKCLETKGETVQQKLNKLPIGTIIKINGGTEEWKKMEPGYQFKTPFFMSTSKFSYFKKKDIYSFEVVREGC